MSLKRLTQLLFVGSKHKCNIPVNINYRRNNLQLTLCAWTWKFTYYKIEGVTSFSNTAKASWTEDYLSKLDIIR